MMLYPPLIPIGPALQYNHIFFTKVAAFELPFFQMVLNETDV